MARFIQIAMGSGAELSYHLLLARDLGLFKNSDYSVLESDLSEVMRMLSSPSTRLRKSLVA
jgi:four helix bundle protein